MKVSLKRSLTKEAVPFKTCNVNRCSLPTMATFSMEGQVACIVCMIYNVEAATLKQCLHSAAMATKGGCVECCAPPSVLGVHNFFWQAIMCQQRLCHFYLPIKGSDVQGRSLLSWTVCCDLLVNLGLSRSSLATSALPIFCSNA